MSNMKISSPPESPTMSTPDTSRGADTTPPFLRLPHELVSRILFQLNLMGLETVPWTCNQLIYPLLFVCRHLSVPVSRALYHAPSLGRFENSQSFRDGWEQHRMIICRLTLSGCPDWLAWFETFVVLPHVSEAQIRNFGRPQAASVNLALVSLSICIPNVDTLVLDNFKYTTPLHVNPVDYRFNKTPPTFRFHNVQSLKLSRIDGDYLVVWRHPLLEWLLPAVPNLSSIVCVMKMHRSGVYGIANLVDFPNLRRARIVGDGFKPPSLGIGSVAYDQMEHLEIDYYTSSTDIDAYSQFGRMPNLKSLVLHCELREELYFLAGLSGTDSFPALERVVFYNKLLGSLGGDDDELLKEKMVERGFTLDLGCSGQGKHSFSRHVTTGL